MATGAIYKVREQWGDCLICGNYNDRRYGCCPCCAGICSGTMHKYCRDKESKPCRPASNAEQKACAAKWLSTNSGTIQ